MFTFKHLAFLSMVSILTLTGCASSGNGNASSGSTIYHGGDGYHRPCDGFSTGNMSRDAYCNQLENRIIEDEIVRREIEREIIEREIEADIDLDWGVDN